MRRVFRVADENTVTPPQAASETFLRDRPGNGAWACTIHGGLSIRRLSPNDSSRGASQARSEARWIGWFLHVNCLGRGTEVGGCRPPTAIFRPSYGLPRPRTEPDCFEMVSNKFNRHSMFTFVVS